MSGAQTADQARVDELVAQIRDFVETFIIPRELPAGEPMNDALRIELQDAAKRAGVFAPQVAEEFGGIGVPFRQLSPVLQAAGYSPLGAVALNAMAPDEGNMHLLTNVATAEQQERYLRPLAAGQIRSCFGMTEPHPGAGSDPAALRTTATKVTGGWSISGEKRFISGADGAAFVIVMARTEAEGGDGATMFLVDLDAPGIALGRHVPTIDRAIVGGHHHVRFDGCVVPDEAVLGGVGEGFQYAQVRLSPARLTHCMRWLGLARRAFDIMLDRAAERQVFGERLEELGIAQGLIADSAIDIDTADAMIDKAARLLETDPRAGSTAASIAKVHCSEVIERVVDRAIQLCGGDGVSADLPLVSFRDEVRPFRIYDGPNETLRWAIARRASRSRSRVRTAAEEGDGA
ncbi:MAG: acyl-CoA dehydrogenase family protein [Actinobacteria bacterium]|nr:acyl-CoA dehydrogenase family protein [Actinomycetota bacterium]MBU1609938.1 acyl-CoA dehydrogenase family protein [Actinomycetota bacterium]MBU2315280.1 acyl-CoA dehydrogenase family protein [Actinomycetota bacterium]MBU2384589.1 acyl-CoA dehydrogenase family protein [Actinomycetota bacterium]